MKPALAHVEHGVPDVVTITKAAGDRLRASILRALAGDSFSVLELGEIFAMAQPAMSHHLRILAEAGLVTKRKEGTSIFYQRFSSNTLTEAIFAALDETENDADVAANIAHIYERRADTSAHFFAHNQDALSQSNDLIAPTAAYSRAILEELSSLPTAARRSALEVGPGDGALLLDLSHQFEQVLGIDTSSESLQVTAQAVGENEQIDLKQKDFLDLPKRPRYDAIVAAMVLHHMPSPARFFEHARSLLKHQGLLIIAELCTHAHDWTRSHCGDLWLGFDAAQLRTWGQRADLQLTNHQFFAQRNGFKLQVLSLQAS